MMNRMKGFDCFYFQDKRLFNPNIEPQFGIEYHAVIKDRNLHLFLDFKSHLLQFIKQTRFINTFEQSGSKDTKVIFLV